MGMLINLSTSLLPMSLINNLSFELTLLPPPIYSASCHKSLITGHLLARQRAGDRRLEDTSFRLFRQAIGSAPGSDNLQLRVAVDKASRRMS